MHQLLIECRYYFFLKYCSLSAYLTIFCKYMILYVLKFIKNLFQTEKFVLFIKKFLKNPKKPKKPISSGFFRWVFWGFFGGVFYCQPCFVTLWNRQSPRIFFSVIGWYVYRVLVQDLYSICLLSSGSKMWNPNPRRENLSQVTIVPIQFRGCKKHHLVPYGLLKVVSTLHTILKYAE